jgi:hypothetical protein
VDLNQTEMLVVEQAADQAHVNEMRQLVELQLVLVGGGIGETIL